MKRIMLIKDIIRDFDKAIVFSNTIGEFHVSVNRVQYTLLRNKYHELAKKIYQRYVEDWKGYSDCGTFLKLEENRFQNYLQEALEEVKNDLISLGIFDIDTKTLMEYADKMGYYEDYQTVYDAFVQKVQQINGNLEYEKAQREYRKQNRARWVGASFRSRSNYVDDYLQQAELGMRNMAEGAGHTVINAIGNMMSTANANSQLNQLFNNQDIRKMFNEGILNAVWNLHFVLMDFLLNRLDMNIWDVPNEDNENKAERLLNNLGSSVLSEEERKSIIRESFALNPYSNYLYETMFHNYAEDVDNITEIAKYFGSDLIEVKEKKAFEFLKSKIGTTEEEAKIAKEELLKYYQELGIIEFEELPSYKFISETLEKFDIEYRTVDSILFETREEADKAKEELSAIKSFMESIQPPTKDDTLEYEEELKKKRDEFAETFQSKLKDKYLAQIDKYLLDFDKKFCTISLLKRGTRKESAKVKAVNFLKKQDTSTKENREEALEKLREYLPKIGLLEEEATEALEYLKKKEIEELCGKESSFSKISKGIGGFFKK